MFEQRTYAPLGNKYYVRIQNGGVNPCIVGNYPKGAAGSNRIGVKGANVLPNCVGWATGRFNEIAGEGTCKWLGNTDAKNYISLAKSQGLKYGLTPKLGAVIVWTNPGAGHVAVVEKIISDKEIIVSQSGWNSSKTMWNAVHKKGADGHWTEGGDSSWMGNYKFLGFIYQPKEVFEMTQDEFNKMADNYILSLGTKQADLYAKDPIEWGKKEGIMNDGMPKSFVTRQDCITMLSRLYKLIKS